MKLFTCLAPPFLIGCVRKSTYTNFSFKF